jgi:pterin-4a-carbinolamine dehydratase
VVQEHQVKEMLVQVVTTHLKIKEIRQAVVVVLVKQDKIILPEEEMAAHHQLLEHLQHMPEVGLEYSKVKVAMLALAMVETLVVQQVQLRVLVVQVLLYSDILSHHPLQFSHSQIQVRLLYQQMFHQ